MKDSGRQFFQALLGYVRPRALTTGGLVVFGALLEGVGIVLLLGILHRLFGTEGTPVDEIARPTMLAGVVLAFALLMITRAVVVVARDVHLQALATGFVNDCRNRLFASLAAGSWRKVTMIERSQIEHTLMTDIQRLSQGVTLCLRASASAVLLTVQAAIALAVAPLLTLIVLVFLGGLSLLLLPIVKRSRQTGEALTSSGRQTMRLLGDFLSGLKLARTHGATGRYVGAYGERLEEWRSRTVDFTRQQSITGQAFQLAAAAAAALTAFIGLAVLGVPLASVAIVLLILMRLTVPALGIIRAAQSFANMIPAYENYRLTLGLAGPPETTLEASGAGESHGSGPAAEIVLDDVTYVHGRSGEPLLENLSARIPAGALAVLTGPSGSGKTTLVDLISGLLPPSSGQLLVDGQPLDAGHSAAWFREISYVPQDPFLFDDSIRENLKWSAPAATDDDLWQVLRTAGADAFVHAQPGGLDTRVGERGTQISGGERQRLCLARALLRRPRLLILDEATNALDRSLEADILGTVAKLSSTMTVIIITHRVDAVPSPDLVLILENAHLRTRSAVMAGAEH